MVLNWAEYLFAPFNPVINVLPRSRQGREEVQAGDDQGRPWPSKFNMQAANEHYKMKRDDSFELALHLPGDEVAFNLSSLTSDWTCPAEKVEPQLKGGWSLQGGGQLPGPAAVLSEKAGNINIGENI